MTRAPSMHAEHRSFFWVPIPTVFPWEACEMYHGLVPGPLLAAGGFPALMAGLQLQ